MLLEIHPDNPQDRYLKQVVDVLEDGGIVVLPTDTVYGIAGDSSNQKAIERISRLKHLDPSKALFTLLCQDISQLAQYAWQLDNQVFKLIKRNTPGPFTFILKSGRALPKLLLNRRKTIGVRIPANPIAQAIIEKLGRPLISTSLIADDDIHQYPNDPFDIHEEYENLVDLVIDGGIGGMDPSAVVDCTESPYEIIRQGPVDLIE